LLELRGPKEEEKGVFSSHLNELDRECSESYFFSTRVLTIPDGFGAKYFSHCSSLGVGTGLNSTRGAHIFWASLPHCGRPKKPSDILGHCSAL
jgi:hypothetical protein